MNRPMTLCTLFLTSGLTAAITLIAVLFVSTTLASSNVRQRSSVVLASSTQTDTHTNSISTAETTTISYQGNLTDTDGTPINGTLPMTFALYRDRTGGTAIWTEERTGDDEVPVTDGLFTVMLGSMEPLEISLFDEDLWLGISINGDDEMSPREVLGDVAYAAVAGTVVEGALSQTHAPGLVAGPQDNTKVADGSVAVPRKESDARGFIRVDIEEYGFTETPTILCSMAGSNAFHFQCHVEYETTETFGIWIRSIDNSTDWTSKDVRWIAIGQ